MTRRAKFASSARCCGAVYWIDRTRSTSFDRFANIDPYAVKNATIGDKLEYAVVFFGVLWINDNKIIDSRFGDFF